MKNCTDTVHSSFCIISGSVVKSILDNVCDLVTFTDDLVSETLLGDDRKSVILPEICEAEENVEKKSSSNLERSETEEVKEDICDFLAQISAVFDETETFVAKTPNSCKGRGCFLWTSLWCLLISEF